MSEPASISLSIAGRYAQALFELAKEAGGLKALEADAGALGAALKESPEFAAMIASPVIARDEQAAAVQAVAAKMGVSAFVANTLALMASKQVYAPTRGGLGAIVTRPLKGLQGLPVAQPTPRQHG